MTHTTTKGDGTSCCGQPPDERKALSNPIQASWSAGRVETAFGPIPRVSTTLTMTDRIGTWKARWGTRRMHYLVEPGLYAVGSPTPESLVLVSANYKMSFDRLRSQLEGFDAWILVLDTRGINVWCAAGKGTFGTDEIVRRIDEVRLEEIVTHRKLIVPQLGATGVKAHEVKHRSGFRVVYGPVRAEDLPDFLDSGMKATPEMRRVRFPLKDRLALVPMELTMSTRNALLAAACFFLLSGLGQDGYSLARMRTLGFLNVGILLGAWLSGMVLTPWLLPWLPGRAFSVKGAWIGLLYLASAGWLVFNGSGLALNWAQILAWILIIPAVTSHLGMNFTGASTYTSLSGVLKEMRVALPLQIGTAVLGLALWIGGLFV